MDLLPLSIGIGLGISLLFSEIFGLAAGGMIVPGYFALHLNKPFEIIFTLLAALITFFIVRLISFVSIVYGRRRTVLTILVGFLVGFLFQPITQFLFQSSTTINVDVIGYIIPGLIAIWYDRQGVIETISSLLIGSVLVRIILIITVGNELKP